jgi:putative ABC transport system substrate-binding protein
MRRREFMALTGAAAAFPRVAVAQQATQAPRAPGGRPWVIAALVTGTKAQSDIDTLTPFRRGMNNLGYVEGRDYRIEDRYTDGDNTRYPALARELLSGSPDVILGLSAAGALAFRDLNTTIPVLAFINTPDAIDQLIGNYSRPIGNVTGINTNSATLTGKHCDLAIEIVPNTVRLGALAVAPDNASSAEAGRATREAVMAAAAARKLIPIIVDVSPTNVLVGFQQLAADRVNAVVVGSGFNGDRAWVAQCAAMVRLPTIYNEQGYVELGGLISYGFDRKATVTGLGSLVDRLLRGARPSDIPFQEPSQYVLAVNLRIAKSLGVTIPPTLLFRADEVIE